MGIRERLASVAERIFGKSAGDRWWTNVVPAWRSGRPAEWAEDVEEQVRHYRHWTYAAVRAISGKVAGTDMRVFWRDGEDVRELVDPAHPLKRLFEEVNPFETRHGLWARTVTFLELTGNAYWYVGENGLGTPAEIWLIPSQMVRVIPDRGQFIKGYVCRHEGAEVTFDRREIVHLKYPNPRSLYYGRGSLQAAAESVDAHEKLKRAQCRAFDQGLLNQVTFESDRQLHGSVVERLHRQLEQRYAGPENAGKPLILESGLRANRIALTPREMAFLQSSRITRDEILGIFGVPAAVAGLSEDVNRSVAEAMDVIFAKYCIEPKLRLIEAQLNQDLVRRFDGRLFCRFASTVPEDRAQERADMEANLRAGVTTINEERRRQGREAVAWGDRPLLASNIVPMRDAEKGTTE